MSIEEKKEKFGVGIWTVLDFLGIDIPNKDNFYITCQNCGSSSSTNRKTLNINIPKEAFRCPRCDISGGYLDLFSLYYYGEIKRGYRKSDMMRDMRKANYSYKSIKSSKQKFIDLQIEPEKPLLPIKERDVVYRELLKNSTLSRVDYSDLKRRGLSEKAIDLLGYKSSNFMGDKVAYQMRLSGLNLNGVPGFYRNKEKGEVWDIVYIKGYCIPYKDFDGNIQGMQIRTNNKRNKYMWLSSKSKNQGSGAKSWPHFAQTFTSVKNRKAFILTEGGLKADIINFFTGLDVVAMPGVNALKQLDPLLNRLKEEGYTDVYTAFDMDFLSNKYVRQAYDKLIDYLKMKNFKISVLKWDPKYCGKDTEGLDDYLLELSNNDNVDFFKGERANYL